ncbi:MAG: hypothetical protein KDA58_13315, partial [Planctomycetaceae bacterium]|nr:hypothetical protein [Planctomycetaceae bacterium]
MWQFVGDKLKYYSAVGAVFALTMGVRYLTYWQPEPVDPTRQGVLLDLPESESAAVATRETTHTTWQVPFVTLRGQDPVTGEFTAAASNVTFGVSEVRLPAYRTRGRLPLVDETTDDIDQRVQRA